MCNPDQSQPVLKVVDWQVMEPIEWHSAPNKLLHRARDSPDDDEKEILSSTSANVREIWNGNRVVRQTGESKTTEIVYDSAWTDTPLCTSKPTEGLFVRPVLSLTEALGDVGRDANKQYHVVDQLSDKIIYRILYRILPPEIPIRWNGRMFYGERLHKRAPNLTMNIDKTIPAPGRVLLYLGLGLFIQAMVVAVNATVVYYLHWPRGRSAVAAYGYPLWALGTLCISLGVTICARVVQSTTEQYNLAPRKNVSRDGLRIIRLQDRIATANIPAYAIPQSEANHRIRISLRAEKLTLASTRTTIGAFLTLTGFVCQNIGTRELHWSAGILQLGATLLLATIRALLRGQVGRKPDLSPVRLPEGAESDTLVTNLDSSGCYVLSAIYGGSRYDDELGMTTTSIWKRLPGSHLMDNDTDDHSKRTSELRLKALRMLVLQYELLRWLPERTEILELTDSLCKAMAASHSFLSGETYSDISWTQYMVLSEATHIYENKPDPPADLIVGIDLTWDKSSLSNITLESTRCLIQSMISLSRYHYRGHWTDQWNGTIVNESDPRNIFPILWILASGTQKEIEEHKALVLNLVPNLNQNFGRLRRDYRDKLQGPLPGQFLSFGLGHSSRFTNG